jgi:hypothetical protein
MFLCGGAAGLSIDGRDWARSTTFAQPVVPALAAAKAALLGSMTSALGSAPRRAAAADRWPQMPRKLARPHRGTPSKGAGPEGRPLRFGFMPPSFRRR